MTTTNHRDVLVLSGGAARGAVQVGMAEVLLARGVRPAALVGTSVGALNAAYLAADPTPTGAARLGALWSGLSGRDVFPGSPWTRLGHVVRNPASLYSSAGLQRMIAAWAPTARLEDLPVPVRVVTARLDTSEAVYHSSGELARLLLASTALPGIFDPVRLDDGTHVDGGIADLVPVAGTAGLGATRIFVLDASVPARLGRVRSPLDVLLASLACSMRVRAAVDPGPGVEVHHLRAPDLGTRMSDFSRTRDHLALGREAALEHLFPVPTAA
ncbi:MULTISPECIES: patatin-like phospholipase family protein [Nocardioides]|uniref:NTE family protein n=1 Tax=Nocardioides lianchengensis TaxID=1045774 RepID=A0A1G6Z8Q4_9ACTN|nr:patatin-like phospholipase family protein [Nocardioides lianchengensis]NYG11479.1 NTE family protein [Nocardioides lianchengensis]SDD98842.1 NTE family protein [Nocardioides lianchengensis]